MSEIDEMVRNQRLEDIAEARKNVIQDERSLNEALETGRVDEATARRLLQRAVDAYVRELEFLLNPTDEDRDPNRYWTDVEIGTIPLPNGGAATVTGLGQYLNLNEEIEVAINRRDSGRYFEMPKEETDTVTIQPPRSLIQSAFRTANAAASDIGLELDLGDSESAGWDTEYRNGDHDTTA